MFSAGYDIGTFDDAHFEEEAESLVAHPFHAALEALEAYRYPVVAALNGHAIGGGLELALTATSASPQRGIKVGMPPAKLGLIYSHTGLRKFIEVCGLANTNELFLVGRNVESDRAYDMGLVNQVVEPDELEERALAVAGEIAANAPLSLRGQQAHHPRAAAHPGGSMPDRSRASWSSCASRAFAARTSARASAPFAREAPAASGRAASPAAAWRSVHSPTTPARPAGYTAHAAPSVLGLRRCRGARRPFGW